MLSENVRRDALLKLFAPTQVHPDQIEKTVDKLLKANFEALVKGGLTPEVAMQRTYRNSVGWMLAGARNNHSKVFGEPGYYEAVANDLKAQLAKHGIPEKAAERTLTMLGQKEADLAQALKLKTAAVSNAQLLRAQKPMQSVLEGHLLSSGVFNGLLSTENKSETAKQLLTGEIEKSAAKLAKLPAVTASDLEKEFLRIGNKFAVEFDGAKAFFDPGKVDKSWAKALAKKALPQIGANTVPSAQPIAPASVKLPDTRPSFFGSVQSAPHGEALMMESLKNKLSQFLHNELTARISAAPAADQAALGKALFSKANKDIQTKVVSEAAKKLAPMLTHATTEGAAAQILSDGVRQIALDFERQMKMPNGSKLLAAFKTQLSTDAWKTSSEWAAKAGKELAASFGRQSPTVLAEQAIDSTIQTPAALSSRLQPLARTALENSVIRSIDSLAFPSPYLSKLVSSHSDHLTRLIEDGAKQLGQDLAPLGNAANEGQVAKLLEDHAKRVREAYASYLQKLPPPTHTDDATLLKGFTNDLKGRWVQPKTSALVDALKLEGSAPAPSVKTSATPQPAAAAPTTPETPTASNTARTARSFGKMVLQKVLPWVNAGTVPLSFQAAEATRQNPEALGLEKALADAALTTHAIAGATGVTIVGSLVSVPMGFASVGFTGAEWAVGAFRKEISDWYKSLGPEALRDRKNLTY